MATLIIGLDDDDWRVCLVKACSKTFPLRAGGTFTDGLFLRKKTSAVYSPFDRAVQVGN